MTEQPDYEKTYDEFWKEIVERPDGTLDLDQLKRELADYRMVLREVGEVYCHVTGGQISKPHTAAATVIAVADDRVQEIVAEAIAERLGEVP
ncbi:hypothetical protein ACFYY8_31390 [Streptosporangium sp. NPDC001559]|uniref:hypothetical protein n=1 Tax=Streptosporangium sp. NPDC001559 TaxID=3366187 RepID=UPI0036EE5565